MEVSMKTSELLRNGYDTLLTKGWGRFGYVSEDGSVCSLGALGVRCGLPLTDAQKRAGNALARAACGPNAIWAAVPWWNDMTSSGEDEVLDAFLEAIKLAEKEEAGE
jgi:hypothetical protein